MTLKILSSVLVLGSLMGAAHNMAYFGSKSYLDNIWLDCLLSELAGAEQFLFLAQYFSSV